MLTTLRNQKDVMCAVTWLRHVSDGDVLLLGHEAEHGEDGEAPVQTRAAVDGRDDHTVPETVSSSLMLLL